MIICLEMTLLLILNENLFLSWLEVEQRIPTYTYINVDIYNSKTKSKHQ